MPTILSAPPRLRPPRRAAVWALLCVVGWMMGGLALSQRAVGAAAAAPPSLQVLHWWTSASERRAANLLATRLGEQGVEWRDAAVPGGAGVGAGKVLRGRVLAGDAPEVTQMIGVGISEAAQMGLLLELDGVAAEGQWAQVLFPAVLDLVRHRGHVVAAPLGIHRINMLFFHRGVFDRLRLEPPRSWAEFERVAATLRAAGIKPLAQSSEAWQVATLFESLVLAEGGPALHRELFVQHAASAVADPRLLAALERLRALKAHMGAGPGGVLAERPWTQVLAQLMRGEAAMMVMGDWAKGELLEAGWVPEVNFGCIAVPGTARYHLYSVDTFTMFAKDYAHSATQERLARLVVTPAVQAEFNAIKGSVPVRRDADPSRMDPCARASWTSFAQDPAQQAPSLVHRMATDEPSKDAIIAELHRYFVDERISPADVQRRLAAIFRVLPARPAR